MWNFPPQTFSVLPKYQKTIIWVVVSNMFYFHRKIGELIQFDEHIFQMGWFNHQLVIFMTIRCSTYDDRSPLRNAPMEGALLTRSLMIR